MRDRHTAINERARTMASFQYFTLDPPAQWQAGTVGSARTPFYFDCADCGAHEPPIAAIVSTDGTFSGIGLIRCQDGIMVKPAMYCADCAAKRIPPTAAAAVAALATDRSARLPETDGGANG